MGRNRATRNRHATRRHPGHARRSAEVLDLGGHGRVSRILDHVGRQRPDQGGPKESRYSISKTTSPATLRELLSQALGEVGGVEKHRTLFLIGRTRIHLDRVKGLGDFLELEVVLGEHEAPQAGIGEAQKLMAKLGVKPSQLVHGAYLDLLPSEDSER